MLFLGFAINAAYILWKSYLWIRKPGLINMKLFVEQKGTKRKILPIDYVPSP